MPQRIYLPPPKPPPNSLPNREKFCEIFFGFSLLSENRGEEAADRREETEEGSEGLREALSGGGRRFSGGCRMGNIRRVRPPVVARMGRCCTWMEDPLLFFLSLWMMSGQMGSEGDRGEYLSGRSERSGLNCLTETKRPSLEEEEEEEEERDGRLNWIMRARAESVQVKLKLPPTCS